MRKRNAKECSQCGQFTRKWSVNDAGELVCGDCYEGDGDRLSRGFSMLGASDDSIECDRDDDDQEMDGVIGWF